MKTGIEAFGEERLKQIEKHGFTGEHHANHPEWYDQGQLVDAARILTDKNDIGQYPVNWDSKWFSDLKSRSYIKRLVIAGALLAAEYDRLTYIENQNQ